MAEELGATVLVVKEIRLPTLPSGQLDAGDSAGSRQRWEAFQAGLEKLAGKDAQATKGGPKPASSPQAKKWPSPASRGAEAAGAFSKRRHNRDMKWEAAGVGAGSSLGTTSDSASTPPPTPPSAAVVVHCESVTAEDGTSGSRCWAAGLTDELAPFTRSQARSVDRKKYGSILDDDPPPSASPAGRTHGEKHVRKPRKHRGAAGARLSHDGDDGGSGIFGMFELDLSDLFPTTSASSLAATTAAAALAAQPSTDAVSAKQKKNDSKAAKKKVKKALKASSAARPATDDDCGWAGESLDVWGDAPPHAVAGTDSDVAPLSLAPPLDDPPASTPQTLGTAPAPAPPPAPESTASSPPAVSSDSLTPSPSPLLVPTYRPPPSLLPRAFPAQPDHGITAVSLSVAAAGEQDDQDEGGTERLCVEVLVVRKEMENHLNIEDFAAKWDVETLHDEA